MTGYSVWQDVESLRRFAFESAHADALRTRGSTVRAFTFENAFAPPRPDQS